MPTPGPLELVIILVIALLILGPGRLPDVGSALGKSLREFRKASSDIQESIKVDTSPLPPDPAPAPPVAPPAVVAASPVVAPPPVVAASPVAPAPVASDSAPTAAPPGEIASAPAPQASTEQPGSESTS
jgi:TatA/E family protein of Tat protein translocase